MIPSGIRLSSRRRLLALSVLTEHLASRTVVGIGRNEVFLSQMGGIEFKPLVTQVADVRLVFHQVCMEPSFRRPMIATSWCDWHFGLLSRIIVSYPLKDRLSMVLVWGEPAALHSGPRDKFFTIHPRQWRGCIFKYVFLTNFLLLLYWIKLNIIKRYESESRPASWGQKCLTETHP